MLIQFLLSDLLYSLKNFCIAIWKIINNYDFGETSILLKQFYDSVGTDVSNSTCH